MDFMDISKMRVTVRKFAQMPVEQEKIEKILEAGQWAPTAVNYQPQRVLVLNTLENLEKVNHSAPLITTKNMQTWQKNVMIKNMAKMCIIMVRRWCCS